MERTIIDVIYDENLAAITFLKGREEISLASDIDNKLKKLLLFSAASFFESEIQDAIRGFVLRASGENPALVSLSKQATERKYHTYFDWDGNNANKFFGIFGEVFLSKCKEKVKASADLQASVRAFLELGNTRNELAHLNFAVFPVEKTADELYELYRKAAPFVDFVRDRLNEA